MVILRTFCKPLTVKEKTKHNILSTIHHFYTWMKRRQEIASLPDFPVVTFELGYRQDHRQGNAKGCDRRNRPNLP